MLLMMFHKQIAEIPLDRCFPFKSNGLAVMPGPRTDIFFVLKDILNVHDETFSIKELMEKLTVFGCSDFEDAMQKFSQIFKPRLERFFETKKAEYIFFDREEQEKLRGILKAEKLSAIVDVYIHVNGKNKRVNLKKIHRPGYLLLKKSLEELGVVVTMRPEEFMRMSQQANSARDEKSGRFNAFRQKQQEKEQAAVQEILQEFPTLNVQSKDEFKKEFRKLAQLMHPDVNADNPKATENFANLNAKVEKLKQTLWYLKLKEGENR